MCSRAEQGPWRCVLQGTCRVPIGSGASVTRLPAELPLWPGLAFRACAKLPGALVGLCLGRPKDLSGGLLWEPRPPLLLPPQPGRRRPCEGEPPAQASPSFPRLRLLSHSLGGHRAGGVEGHPGRLPQSPPWMCRPYLQACVLSSLPWGAPLSAWRRKGGRTQEAAPPTKPFLGPFLPWGGTCPGGHSTQHTA